MEKLIFDKKYAEMSWLEQASEIIECPEQDYILSLPAEIPIPNETIRRYMSAYGLDVDRTYAAGFTAIGLSNRDDRFDVFNLRATNIYTLTMSDDFAYDLTKREVISGTITLVKQFTPKENNELIETISRQFLDTYCNSHSTDLNEVARAREILELVDQQVASGCKSRKVDNLHREIMNAISGKIKEHKWRIRSTVLSKKMIKWVKDYILHNKTNAIVHLTKLKLSTYQQAPIYSIPEEE